MNWKLRHIETKAEDVFELLKRHRLLHESVEASAYACRALGDPELSTRYRIEDDGGDRVCDVFLTSVILHDTAMIDLVPVPKHFRRGFDDAFAAAMRGVLGPAFAKDCYDLRRITSLVPASRSRTKRALCALGFKPEGRMREAVNLHRDGIQDLRVLGLLKSEYEGESDA